MLELVAVEAEMGVGRKNEEGESRDSLHGPDGLVIGLEHFGECGGRRLLIDLD
jgi:hypothetical protein